jgi:hypothetical protein
MNSSQEPRGSGRWRRARRRAKRRLLTALGVPALFSAAGILIAEWPSDGSRILWVYFWSFLLLATVVLVVGLFHPRPPRWPAARVAIFIGGLTNLAIMVVDLAGMICAEVSWVGQETYGLLILLIVGGVGAAFSGANRIEAQGPMSLL